MYPTCGLTDTACGPGSRVDLAQVVVDVEKSAKIDSGVSRSEAGFDRREVVVVLNRGGK
jgi:hypothetical protein